MKKISIGTKGESFDLDTLLPTRLLIQANSGGGKSWLIRKLVEQLFGKIQIIIIDPEGEFASLREKFDFVLAGKGGETAADTRSASLLATRLLELNASAICDIYELKSQDRHRWVKLFLSSLIDSPKNLWRPLVVIVDEAHLFAPEKGQGESEAFTAMIDLASRGRKRGFCPIFATQRLGKLSKNVCAELQNVMIGSTFLDIDRKRAAETLGVAKANEKAFSQKLKMLEPGYFYSLGRAISKDIQLIKIGNVATSHPQSGSKLKHNTPPTPSKIKKLLPQLSDLPQQADSTSKSIQELKLEIAELKKINDQLLKGQLNSPSLKEEVLKKQINTMGIEISLRDKKIKSLQSSLEKIAAIATESMAFVPFPEIKLDTIIPKDTVQTDTSKKALDTVKSIHNSTRDKSGHIIHSQPADDSRLAKGEKIVLIAIAQFGSVENDQLSVLTGYKRSSRDAYLNRLKSKGYITTDRGTITISQSGILALGESFEPLPTGDGLRAYWFSNLPEGERKILQLLCDQYPNTVNKESLETLTGYKRSSRDAYLNRLQAKRLVNLEIRGEVRASDNLF